MSHPSTLAMGSTGSEVERLQQDLSALKYEVEINGSFDANTEAAVKKFQQQNDLKVDGVVGQQTGQKLGMALKP
ncbi:MAG: peptidoglycan-binding domain-containing protein [Pleurocapsa sp. MO_226.B13]|nr:peptidoglycan-binding domain-containing protein [Pleurocapsa sp. MO_226.B13]